MPVVFTPLVSVISTTIVSVIFSTIVSTMPPTAKDPLFSVLYESDLFWVESCPVPGGPPECLRSNQSTTHLPLRNNRGFYREGFCRFIETPRLGSQSFPFSHSLTGEGGVERGRDVTSRVVTEGGRGGRGWG